MVFSLSASLDGAEFKVESFGPVERQARIRGHAVSPGTADYPPRLLMGFADEDGTWIVNLRDGSSRKAESPGFDADSLQWPTFIGADGKVFSSCGAGGLSVYDPVSDAIKMVRPIPGARWLRGMAIGPDSAVYVSDYPTGSAARYDPKTGEVANFGPQGGPFSIKNIYGYSVGSDGRFVYTAAGKMPWHVVAYDTRAASQKVLLTFEPADHPEVHQRGGEVFLEVTRGAPKKGEPATASFRLIDGQVEPVDVIPKFDDANVPGIDGPQIEFVPFERGLPIFDKGAVVTYRMTGQMDWKSAMIPVRGQDMGIERIAPLRDGRLLVSTGPYGNVHVFDPKSGALSLLGNPASKNVYDLMETDGRIYFCGYPNSIFGEFNNKGAIIIGDWHEGLASKHTVFIVKGADGRIYSGNHNERESTGGALGWYDPGSGKFGGIHFPNDDCEFLTTALGGRIVVYASDFTYDPSHPEITNRDGQLFFYDTEVQRVVRQFSPLSGGSAGVIVETEPGKLFGIGLHEKLPVMYSAEVASGRVIERIPLPAVAHRFIAKGPDGMVYFFVKDSLVRADPKTFSIETLRAAEPGRMVFVGADLYIAGTPALRKMSSVASGK